MCREQPTRLPCVRALNVSWCTWPSPIPNLRPINSFGIGVFDTVDDPAFQPFLEVCAGALQTWDAVDDIDRQVEAVDLIADRQFQWRVDIAFFFVAAYVNIRVVGPPISELVNQPRVSVKIENHRLVPSKQRIEIAIGQPVRVLRIVLQAEQINDVHKADLEVREMLSENGDGSQCLLRQNVACAGDDDVRFCTLSLLAHSQIPMPFVQWMTAASMSRYTRCGCLSDTITLT